MAKPGYPDHTAFDPKDKHFDPKSKQDNPTWYMVDIKYVRKLKQMLTLEQLHSVAALKNMVLLQKGSRLSVQPVTAAEWEAILKLSH